LRKLLLKFRKQTTKNDLQSSFKVTKNNFNAEYMIYNNNYDTLYRLQARTRQWLRNVSFEKSLYFMSLCQHYITADSIKNKNYRLTGNEEN